ncbi:hypothetical protein P5673_014290 [Acropora cervicornis]|uniref:Uncharacterized protein n=1 Tax=Acropora cervicornis TaxID=6130 RepID=A0AAD9QJS4_ACRCE|nr:hypothetical protein P5673_014290 [Acropora cervicornis]
MALRSLTKAPKLCLVYFSSDKSTCIVETKRLRDRETQKFIDFEPPKMTIATLRNRGKELEAMVIASGKPQNGTKRTTDGPVSSPQRKKEDRPEKDEVQLLSEFRHEQEWKQAESRKKRDSVRRQIISGDASIQCDIRVVSRSAVCTSDASVQTEYYDVTSELQQQIRNLAQVVKQLTSLKFIHQHEPKILASPDDPLSDPVLDPALSANAASANPTESPVQPTRNHNHKELSPLCPPLLAPTRQPLLSIDQNVPLQSSTRSHGPTNEQRRNVAVIVDMGKDMSTVALACMDVLFTDDEMARCNTSGSKGFEQLDSSKLSFLFSALKNKFDSPMFGEKWNQTHERHAEREKNKHKPRKQIDVVFISCISGINITAIHSSEDALIQSTFTSSRVEI